MSMPSRAKVGITGFIADSAVCYDGYISLEYIWMEWMHCNEVDNVSEIIQLHNLLRNRHCFNEER